MARVYDNDSISPHACDMGGTDLHLPLYIGNDVIKRVICGMFYASFLPGKFQTVAVFYC